MSLPPLPPVSISISNDIWYYNGQSGSATWQVTGASTQTFVLTQPGYCFVGIAFDRPNKAFAGGLTSYSISNTPSASNPNQIGSSVLTLQNYDTKTQVVGFRFVVSAPGGTVLISPDPQDDDTCAPPPPP